MAYIEYTNVSDKYLKEFCSAFSGEIYYAVKANPTSCILTDLLVAGIDGFDVASISEIQAVRAIAPEIPIIFTHPIKSRNTIAEAYFNWDIRSFAVDCTAEWEKISGTCSPSKDLEIFVRLKSLNNNSSATIDLDDKFGATLKDAVELTTHIAAAGAKVSWSFHPGSQQLNPSAHYDMVVAIAEVLQLEQIRLHRISIGGGFPVSYDNCDTLPIRDYPPDIETLKQTYPILRKVSFLAEPGRYLSASSMDLVVNVIMVDKDRIFIDEGIYGALLDSALVATKFPLEMVSGNTCERTGKFTIFGPTCDSLDRLPGQYKLPSNIREGDQLRIRNAGAYGTALTEDFNGLCPKLLTKISRESSDISAYKQPNIAING